MQTTPVDKRFSRPIYCKLMCQNRKYVDLSGASALWRVPRFGHGARG